MVLPVAPQRSQASRHRQASSARHHRSHITVGPFHLALVARCHLVCRRVWGRVGLWMGLEVGWARDKRRARDRSRVLGVRLRCLGWDSRVMVRVRHGGGR